MGDTRFSCPSCGQPLVTDGGGGGLLIDCPECAQPLQIPFDPDPELDLRIREIISELSDREAALKGEVEHLIGRHAELETDRGKAEAALHEASAELIRARKRIEKLQAERKESAAEAERLSGELTQSQRDIAQLRAELSALQKAHSDATALIERQRKDLAENESRAATFQSEREAFEKDLAGMKTTLANNRKETAAIREEHAKLCSEVAQNHEMAEFVELKRSKEKLDRELQEARSSLDDTRQKLEESERQRSALRDRSVDLELKLAAAREAFSESQLAQDNEILRKLVERINEELKERSPAPKKTGANPQGIMGSVASLWR